VLATRQRDRHARQFGHALGTQSIDPHWPSDILDALLAHVLEGVIDPVSHLIVRHPADADAARFCKSLQARRNVDPVSVNVVPLGNHVAEVDADAELNSLLWRDAIIAPPPTLLTRMSMPP
jgi:hypothetical protein